MGLVGGIYGFDDDEGELHLPDGAARGRGIVLRTAVSPNPVVVSDSCDTFASSSTASPLRATDW